MTPTITVGLQAEPPLGSLWPLKSSLLPQITFTAWRSPQRWVEAASRSEEHTSELPSLMRISYAGFCLKKQKTRSTHEPPKHTDLNTITYPGYNIVTTK